MQNIRLSVSSSLGPHHAESVVQSLGAWLTEGQGSCSSISEALGHAVGHDPATVSGDEGETSSALKTGTYVWKQRKKITNLCNGLEPISRTPCVFYLVQNTQKCCWLTPASIWQLNGVEVPDHHFLTGLSQRDFGHIAMWTWGTWIEILTTLVANGCITSWLKLLKIDKQQIKMSALYQFGLEYICFEMYLGICDLFFSW